MLTPPPLSCCSRRYSSRGCIASSLFEFFLQVGRGFWTPSLRWRRACPHSVQMRPQRASFWRAAHDCCIRTNSGWRAENVIFGTQPGVALNRRRAILLKNRFFLPFWSGEVSVMLCSRLPLSDLTARVKRGRSHRRRRLATSFGPHGDPPTGNGVLGVYRTRESYAKAPPPPTSTLT